MITKTEPKMIRQLVSILSRRKVNEDQKNKEVVARFGEVIDAMILLEVALIKRAKKERMHDVF